MDTAVRQRSTSPKGAAVGETGRLVRATPWTTLAARDGWGIDVRNIPRVTINEAGNPPPGYAMPSGPNALRSGRDTGRFVTGGEKTHIR